MSAFYNKDIDSVRQEVNGSLEPLSNQQVKINQEKYGLNELVETKAKSIPMIFLEQYKDFLVIILIIAALISGFLGDIESAIVILIVITINAILGTVQTVKAEQSLNSLKELSSPSAKVLRDGKIIEIPSKEVTIGDEVHLEAGDYIPADGRIIENASMKVDESALTGESLAVEKQTDIIDGQVALGDRTNMVYSGSFVTYGRGKFLVTAIGMETEVGKIAQLLKSTEEKKTPLQVNLDNFGKKLSIIIIVFCICGIMYSGGFFHGENNFIDSFANSDAAAGLSFGSLLSLIVIIIYFMFRRTIKFREMMDAIPEGFKAMIAAILILTLAWTIKTMTDSLGAADYVAGIVESGAESFMNFLPAIVFLVGCGLAFATGTSWGTFGVLIPIVMAVFENYDAQMEIISISACMAGAVMGDHCSPISDTTIMSSAGAQCYHINHVNTQIPYAVTVAVVSFVCYIIAGFVRNAAISLIIAFALMFLVLLALRKKFGAEEKA